MINKMRELRIEKVTLNLGSGKDQDKLAKGLKLFEMLTGRTPNKTITQKRIPTWGVRPGLPIGCKVTVRKKEAVELLKRLLTVIEKLKESNFDTNGSLSFGVLEYMDIPGMKYDPEIGMLGFQACVTFERPGFRIKRRKNQKRSPGKKHLISREDAIKYMKDEFKIEVSK